LKFGYTDANGPFRDAADRTRTITLDYDVHAAADC
jgi:hypothetical protein